MKHIICVLLGVCAITSGFGQGDDWIRKSDSLFQASRYQQALALLKNIPSLSSTNSPKWHLECGRNLVYMASYDSAMNHFLQAKALIGENESHPVLPALYDRMGEWYRWQYFDSHRAIFFSNKALALRVRYHRQDSLGLAQTYYQLGRAYSELEVKGGMGELGDFQKIALAYFEKALAIPALLKEDKDTYGWILNRKLTCRYDVMMRAYANKRQNLERILVLDSLIHSLWEVQAFFEKHFEAPHFGMSHNYHNLGNYTANQNDDAAYGLKANVQKAGMNRSSAFFQEALEQRLQIFGPRHPKIAIIYHLFGYNSRRTGNLQNALIHYAKATNLLLPESVPLDSAYHLPACIPSGVTCLPYLLFNFRELGLLYDSLAINSITPSEKTFALKGKVKTHQLIIEISRKLIFLRNSVYFEGVGTSDLFSDSKDYINALNRLQRIRKSTDSLEFLSSMDQTRSMYLLNKLQTPELAQIQGKLLNLRFQVDSLRLKNISDTDPTMLSLLDESYRLSEISANLISAAEKAFHFAVYHLELPKLQTCLKEDSAQMLFINSWEAGSNLSDGYFVYSLLISPKKQHFRIDTFRVSYADSLLKLIKSVDRSSTLQFDKFAKWSYQLYQDLFKDREGMLMYPKLLIIPDGYVCKIPFDILINKPLDTANRADQYRGLAFLARKFNIAYAPSALAYYQQRQFDQKRKVNEILSMAPSFQLDENQSLESVRKIDLTRKKLVNLPGAQREAMFMEEEMGAQVFRGNRASEDFFKKMATQYQIIHLATHGIAHPKGPLESRVAFSFLPTDPHLTKEDGFLYARELYGLNLNCELTLLSACETGQGRFTRGEGLLGLPHAFLYAGSRSVVTTQWPVPDESSADLVISFMKGLEAGQSKSQALAKAKRAYLETADSRHAHPFYWAGYTLTGDDHNLVFKRKSNLGFYLFIGFIILVVAFFVISKIKVKNS